MIKAMNEKKDAKSVKKPRTTLAFLLSLALHVLLIGALAYTFLWQKPQGNGGKGETGQAIDAVMVNTDQIVRAQQAKVAKKLAEEKRQALAREEAERKAREKAEQEAQAKAELEAKLKAEQEEKTRLMEQLRQQEAERLAQEQRAKEKAKAEEAKRLAQEKAKAEEAKRLAEEKAKAEEAKRLAEEKAKAEEAKRLAEEKAKAEEAKRLAEEKAKAEEAKRLAEEKAKAEEAKRLAEKKAKAEKARRLAEKKAKEEKARRLAQEKAEQQAALDNFLDGEMVGNGQNATAMSGKKGKEMCSQATGYEREICRPLMQNFPQNSRFAGQKCNVTIHIAQNGQIMQTDVGECDSAFIRGASLEAVAKTQVLPPPPEGKMRLQAFTFSL